MTTRSKASPVKPRVSRSAEQKATVTPIAGKRTPTGQRARFLKALRDTANVSAAAAAAGMATSTVYRQRASNAAFARDWNDAIGGALDDLEAAMLMRATHGVSRPIVHGGQTVATVTTYSDTAGTFILKHRRPEIYGGRGTATGHAHASDATADVAKLERQLDIIAARKLPDDE